MACKTGREDQACDNGNLATVSSRPVSLQLSEIRQIVADCVEAHCTMAHEVCARDWPWRWKEGEGKGEGWRGEVREGKERRGEGNGGEER